MRWTFFKFTCLWLAIAAVGALSPLVAQERRLDELFTVNDLHVDITAKSAAAARRQAIQDVEARAFDTILRKLTQPEDRARLPELSHEEKQHLITGISVVGEKTSGRRYVADFQVRFEPELLSEFFAKFGVPHVLDAGAGLMAFHAHQKGQKLTLWEKGDERSVARDIVDWNNRLRQYEWPRGTLKERLALTVKQVADLDEEAAINVASGYDQNAVLLISSVWHGADKGLNYRATLSGSDLVLTGTVLAGTVKVNSELDGSAEVAAIAKMYEDILAAVDRDWRSKLLVDVAHKGAVLFMVPTLNQKDWEKVINILNTLSLVRIAEVKEIGIPLSLVDVSHRGRRDQLFVALREAGLAIIERSDGLLLTLAGSELAADLNN